MRPSTRALRAVLALIPASMLTLAIPIVNRFDARPFGFPLLLVWIVAWVALTPVFLLGVTRLANRP